MALNLVRGVIPIPPLAVVQILFYGTHANPLWREIIWQFRLPETIVAVLAGGALGLSGLQLQTLFRNPLAEPYILGISAGASLGVAFLVLAIDYLPPLFQDVSIVGAAFFGATGVMMLLLGVARSVSNTSTLLILGLLLGYVAISIISILIHFSNTDRLQRYIAWSGGSFSGVTFKQLAYFAPSIFLGILLGVLLIPSLNLLLLGEEYAVSLGLNLEVIRVCLIISSSLLTATVTAYCGSIGFLGIVIPHLCRNIWCTSDHRWLVPGVLVLGAILATLATTMTQFGKVVLPLNAVTTLMGTPIVMWIILKRAK
jgi:iron complex transport system permease protein